MMNVRGQNNFVCPSQSPFFITTTLNIFAQNQFDPDCTGISCSFAWRCDSNLLGSDVQLNKYAFQWSDVDSPYTFSLQKELNHSFGVGIGLRRCEMGDFPSSCVTRLNGNPVPTSGKYALSQTDIDSVFTQMQTDVAIGMATPDGKLSRGKLISNLISYHLRRSQRTVQQEYDDFYNRVIRQTSIFDAEGLALQRKMLTRGFKPLFK
jgi:hypothetical protein